MQPNTDVGLVTTVGAGSEEESDSTLTIVAVVLGVVVLLLVVGIVYLLRARIFKPSKPASASSDRVEERDEQEQMSFRTISTTPTHYQVLPTQQLQTQSSESSYVELQLKPSSQ